MFDTNLAGFEFRNSEYDQFCLYLQNVLLKCITSQMLLLVTSS